MPARQGDKEAEPGRGIYDDPSLLLPALEKKIQTEEDKGQRETFSEVSADNNSAIGGRGHRVKKSGNQGRPSTLPDLRAYQIDSKDT